MTELSREEVLRIAADCGFKIILRVANNQAVILVENTDDSFLDVTQGLERFAAAIYEAGAKSERAVSDRLLEALTELIEVADLRGDSCYVDPCDDPKLWTARMNEAWSDANTAIAEVEAMRKERPE